MPNKRLLLLFLVWLLPAAAPTAAHAQDVNEALLVAARKSDVAAVKELLAKGADVNAKTQYGATPLSYACDRGNLEIVKLLLEHGANVNVKDTFYKATPLTWASSKGHGEIVRALLVKGAEGKEDALMNGVSSGYVEVVKAVLDVGGVKAPTLTSALVIATKDKRTEIVELLKKAGASDKPAFEVDSETLKSYAGVYRSPSGNDFTFTVEGSKLVGGVPGQSFTLLSTDKQTFKVAEFDGLTFVFNLEGGKVVSVTLKQPGNESVLKKVEKQ